MTDEMISVFGCAKDERRLFERYAARCGVEICCVDDPLRHENIYEISPESAISVNHKALVDAILIRTLQERGVRYMSSRSIGLDHIDLHAAKMAGI
jgi:D-specific alpha-keto acid dehydrogenase